VCVREREYECACAESVRERVYAAREAAGEYAYVLEVLIYVLLL
jgi:hypothetical protein